MLQTPRHPERNVLLADAAAKADYTRLLLNDFHALETLIRADGLERDISRVGYELELNFLDRNCEPACIGGEVARALDEPRFTTEFSRFNLEVNSHPIVLHGRCLAQLQSGLNSALTAIREEAAKRDCSVLLTGIIPTLTRAHITPEALTPEPRYQALYEIRRALKGDDYEYRIQGIDELLTRDNIALFAGSVTSFQVHLQVAVDALVDAYNWAQLLAGPVLATAANSPLFLGKQLWQETRIELFEQATDTRVPDSGVARNRPRVFFGDSWVKESVLELLQEDILGFDPLLSADEPEDAQLALSAGQAPRLDAWTLFNSTIYRWNRVCYGNIHGQPSLRIENRMLPSGPTVPDMVANAAFWTGAMAGLPERYRNVQQRLDFALVKENFFKAARYGLDVKFMWFDGPVTARELILDELLPLARSGLQTAGVDEDDSRHFLDILQARTESGKTGAQWLLASFNTLRKTLKPEPALQALTSAMLARQDSGAPVHRWEPVQEAEGNETIADAQCPVHKIMTTTLYKVKADDAIDLVTHLMQWKNVGHVPVEDAQGQLVGMITRNTLLAYMLKPQDAAATARAEQLVEACTLRIVPDTPVRDVLALLVDNPLSCLPVMNGNSIVGLVTEHDLVKLTQALVAGQQAQENAAPGMRAAS
jgi:predicted transcriptional regulator